MAQPTSIDVLPTGGLGISGVNPNWTRQEILDCLPEWQTISDCLEGELVIKRAGTKYLPMPNESDQTAENIQRYSRYKLRANFTNFAGRTHKGYIGHIFSKPSIVEIPDSLDALKTDIDGNGLTIDQLAKRFCGSIIAFGRAGLFVDYPMTQGVVTKQDVTDNNLHPVLLHFRPEQIINWETKVRGSKKYLSLVVIKELLWRRSTVNNYEQVQYTQIRVLRIDETTGDYVVEIWRSDVGQAINLINMVVPKDGKGNTFKEILFKFVGSEDNDETIDVSPLSAICFTNVGHYRNSADYEESVFITGQPTVWASGITDDWLAKVLNGGFSLGGRGGIPLPEGGNAGLLQALPNTLAFEAMGHKETLMVMLGAQIVQQQTAQKTATQTVSEDNSDNSVLATIAHNVSDAITWGLTKAAMFLRGVDSTKIIYTLNDDFGLSSLDPQTLSGIIKAWQSGAIDFEEMRKPLTKAKIAYKDSEEAKKSIDKEQAAMPQPTPINMPRNNAKPNAK